MHWFISPTVNNLRLVCQTCEHSLKQMFTCQKNTHGKIHKNIKQTIVTITQRCSSLLLGFLSSRGAPEFQSQVKNEERETGEQGILADCSQSLSGGPLLAACASEKSLVSEKQNVSSLPPEPLFLPVEERTTWLWRYPGGTVFINFLSCILFELWVDLGWWA